MNAYLFFDPRPRPLSIGGAPMPGAKLKFFVTGTTTPATVYADADLQTALGTEVTADESGQFVPIYLSPLVTYRVQIYDADDVLQPNGDIDPISIARDYAPGTVMLFHGTAEQRDVAYPPALWQVLDGTNGTPNGTNRVLLIAGGDIASGDTGGNEDGETDAAGAHDHGGTVSETVLSSDNMPVHNHRVYVRTNSSQEGNTRGFGFSNTAGLEGQITDYGSFGYKDDAPASGGNKLIEATGSVDPDGHDHGITEEAAHTHTFDALPPYVALWAVMRRAS
jgi:hypothetical protein